MFKSIKFLKYFILFGLPLLMLSSLVLLTNSSIFNSHSSLLSFAITFDLLVTTPFIYFLLIRKTSIPKTTLVPLIVLGLIIGSIIIPREHQSLLTIFKDWILPIIELTILLFVSYKLVNTIRLFKQNRSYVSFDFYTTLKETCYEILPKAVVIPIVTEIAVFYYGFLCWKKRQLKPNEYSYHRDSGTITLLISLIFLIVIETLALHLVLERWTTIIAWIFSILSIYSIIQIVGFTKSMFYRPYALGNDILYLRYGIMNETIIPIEDIASIKLSTKEFKSNKKTRYLSFLGSLEAHNVVIKLKKENTLVGLYGIKKSYITLGLHVDEKHDFKYQLDQLINKNLKCDEA